jgi:hypothetical protein
MKGGGNLEKLLLKLQNLHTSTQKLESALQEVWNLIDDVAEDDKFRELMKLKKKNSSKKPQINEDLVDIFEKINVYKNCIEEIPEDGTVAIDFEDAIAELIECIDKEK